MKENYFLPQNIKLVVSDFDGIFTDGKLEIFSDGKTSKKIDYKDIMGIAIILKKGINFAIISGEKSFAIDILKEKFPNIDVFQNERKIHSAFFLLLTPEYQFLREFSLKRRLLLIRYQN